MLNFKPITIQRQHYQAVLLLVEKFAEGQNFNCAIIQQLTGMPEKTKLDFSDMSQVFLCLLDEVIQKICKKLKFHNDFLKLNYFEKTVRRAKLAAIFSYLE